MTRESCTFVLQEFALKADLDFIIDACTREHTPVQAALKSATLAVRGMEMEKYVLLVNRMHGSVVTSSDFVKRWNRENVPEVMYGAVIERPNPDGDRCERNAASQSVRRWRAEHNSKIGSLRLQEPLELDVKREKASPCFENSPEMLTVSRVREEARG